MTAVYDDYPRWLRYAGAAGAIGVVPGLSFALGPPAAERLWCPTLLLVVLAVARFAGRGPALAATGLGAVAALAVRPTPWPTSASDIASLLGLVLCLAAGAGIAMLVGARSAATCPGDAGAPVPTTLSDAEHRWRMLAETLPNLVWTDLPDGQCDWLSSQWGKYTGIPESELLGLRWLDAVVHPDDRERTLACWTAACHDEADYDLEYRIRRFDGEYRWFKTRGVPVRDAQGRIVYWFGTCTDIEDAKRAEAALRESEAALRAFHDNAPVLTGVVELTDDDDIVHVYDNPMTCRHFGIAPGATAGRRASALGATPEAIAQWIAVYRKSEERGEPVRFEFAYEAGCGRGWLSVAVTPIGQSSSGRARFGYVAEEVTERRRLAEQLEAERSLLDAFFASTTVALGLIDTEFRYLRVNGAMAELNGQTAEAHIGRTLAEVAPGLWPTVEPLVRRVLDSGEPLRDVEVQAEAPADGETRSWLVNYFPVRRNGRIDGMGFAVIETTESRWREARLREAEERLRLALEAGRMGTWDWDIRTGAVTWSNNLEEVHGLPPGGFDRTIEGFQALVHPEDRERVAAEVSAALRDCARYDTEFRIVRPDGSVGWMSGTGQAFADDSGRPVRMLGVGMDITGRKRDELALREADRRKSEFLATLAHELRNPLAPIRNAARLLARSAPVVAECRGEVEMIDRQVGHLARLVDDLLDVARIERGKIVLRRAVVSVTVLVDHAIEAVRPLAEARGHELIVAPPDTGLRVEGDPTRLEQVLGNLLLNALKYTEPGGRVELEARREGDEAVLRVRDNGIGIAPEKLPYVFDMFAQADSSADRAQGGLGIGLGLVKSLVALHGGSVAVHSAGPGGGSEFVVRLPALSADAAAGGQAPPGADGVPLPRRRVLVVDDNRDAANSLARLLSRLFGQEVRVAHDGAEALAVADQFEPEVVLLDIGMPGMDGYEVARRLRERDALRGTRLVALTGWGQEQDRQRSAETGFDLHLVKPADPDALVRVLAASEAGAQR